MNTALQCIGTWVKEFKRPDAKPSFNQNLLPWESPMRMSPASEMSIPLGKLVMLSHLRTGFTQQMIKREQFPCSPDLWWTKSPPPRDKIPTLTQSSSQRPLPQWRRPHCDPGMAVNSMQNWVHSKSNLEITDIELSSSNGNVTWFPHVVGTVEPGGAANIRECKETKIKIGDFTSAGGHRPRRWQRGLGWHCPQPQCCHPCLKGRILKLQPLKFWFCCYCRKLFRVVKMRLIHLVIARPATMSMYRIAIFLKYWTLKYWIVLIEMLKSVDADEQVKRFEYHQ